MAKRPSSKRQARRDTLPCGRPVPAPRLAADAARLEILHGKLKRFLEASKLKYSEQRWTIARAILEAHRHMTPQEIVELIRREHQGIGAATVYRNIKVLEDAKLLKETLIDSAGRSVYEPYDEGHHDHVVCLDCGQIFEFHNEKIEALQQKVLEDMDFEEVRHRHVVYAKCRK